jgi:hypothetical protein
LLIIVICTSGFSLGALFIVLNVEAERNFLLNGL